MSSRALFAAVLVAITAPAVAARQRPPAIGLARSALKQLVDGARAGACKNMSRATINWFDVIGIPVLTFSDNGWSFAMQLEPAGRSGAERLTFVVTRPDERRPTERLSVDVNGRLVRGELGPQPGERVPSRESYETWSRNHKVFAEAAWHPSGQLVGDEFRPFWQALADRALAAAARVIGAQHEAAVLSLATGRLSGAPTTDRRGLGQGWLTRPGPSERLRYALILRQYRSRHACSVRGIRSFGTPRWVSTSSVPPALVAAMSNVAIEKIPSGKRSSRQACTMRLAGTRSTLMPVEPLTLVENLPPTFRLMLAFPPVTAACLRESARSS